MVIEEYSGLVSAIAYEFSRKFYMVEADDVRQELWIWFLTHPKKVKHWENEYQGKQSIKLIARSLRNAAKDYCQKEKARALGYRVEDNYYYDKQLVEVLLPSVLTGDRIAPTITDLSYSNVKKVASEGNNWFAMCADIEKAYNKLTKEQRGIMLLHYGSGFDLPRVALELEISQDAVRMRLNRAINHLLKVLGGERPRVERDYTGDTNDNERAIDEQYTESAE
jgi:RNA polymerase sigma factor (sigma-70 family)